MLFVTSDGRAGIAVLGVLWFKRSLFRCKLTTMSEALFSTIYSNVALLRGAYLTR